MASITESGRIIDVSPMREGKGVLELVNGRWAKAVRPVSSDEIFNARILSDEELSAYMEKSGKSN